MLGLAAFYGNNEAAKLLLSARADANAMDGNYGSPVHWACVWLDVMGFRDFRVEGLGMVEN